MNISSFIVKASSERSVKSLGCLIPMIIGRVPRLSRRNKQLQIKVGSSRLFDTFLAMKKVWNYKIRFSFLLLKINRFQKIHELQYIVARAQNKNQDLFYFALILQDISLSHPDRCTLCMLSHFISFKFLQKIKVCRFQTLIVVLFLFFLKHFN